MTASFSRSGRPRDGDRSGAAEAAVRFIEPHHVAPIQKLIAEKFGFRPGTVVDVAGPIQKLKLLRLGIVRNPNRS